MRKSSHLITSAILASTVLLPFAASAQTPHRPMPNHVGGMMQNTLTKIFHPKPMVRKNMIIGTVSTIDGTTLTLTGSSSTTYTVDASQAKFLGGFLGATMTLSNIQTGDKVMVNGTINGTTVTANTIHDASLEGRTIFGGSVTAINGTSLTIKRKNKTTYSVDASQATFTKGFKGDTIIAASDVQVGDRLMIGGSLNGTSITATQINDMGKMGARMGMFGKMGEHGPRPDMKK